MTPGPFISLLRHFDGWRASIMGGPDCTYMVFGDTRPEAWNRAIQLAASPDPFSPRAGVPSLSAQEAA